MGWTYADNIEGRKDPTIISMLGWPGPYSQYHAANAYEHWLIEMMLTRKEPFNAERLLLSTGIVSYNMDSNWENGRHYDIGRRIATPFMDMTYRSTRGPLFNTGPRPPVINLDRTLMLDNDSVLTMYFAMAMLVMAVIFSPMASSEWDCRYIEDADSPNCRSCCAVRWERLLAACLSYCRCKGCRCKGSHLNRSKWPRDRDPSRPENRAKA